MKKLEDYPNIGVGIASQLKAIGIFNINQLQQMGSKRVIMRLRENNHKIDIQTFFKIDACLRNIPWYQLTQEERRQLKEFFKSMDRYIET